MARFGVDRARSRAPMAGHLLTKGRQKVVGYNRTPAKAAAWAARYPGGRTAETAAKAAVAPTFSCSACVRQ